jgi:predicted Zn finger-like uncharacterized protein
MRIACPSCSAAYEVPLERLRPARKVRCSQCGGEWVPVPAEAADAGDAQGDRSAAEEFETFVDRPPPDPQQWSAMDHLAAVARRRDRLALPAAWAASIALLLALGVAMYVERNAVTRIWPASAGLYAVLGVPGGPAPPPP